MNANRFLLLLLYIILLFLSCSSEHVPTLPVIGYDSSSNNLIIVQTDTSAYDTAYIEIEGLYNKSFSIKDTLSFSISKIIKGLNQIDLAYKLATNGDTVPISIHTSRTNDTILNYIYKSFEIQPIPVAKMLSGNCIGLYDVNYRRDYKEKIRLWIFKRGIEPDSMLIENMNSLMRQFNYSNHNEYSKLEGNIPIVTSLKNSKYRIKTNLPGKYFYLYAGQSDSGIKTFIESKISNGLKDAHLSTSDEFTYNQIGETGVNCLFLIGVDENWKYQIQPIGLVAIDNSAPCISSGRHMRFNAASINKKHDFHIADNSFSNVNSPKRIYLKNQNILINLPTLESSITSSVAIYYGNFEGNDYFGYNIPFYICKSGDVKTIIIGNHKLDANKIKNDECIRLHIRTLHIGDNSLPLSAIDIRGNKSTSSLAISIVSVREESSYDDYDDLDSRISDIENRLDELE